MAELKQPWERLAQAYARRILAGEITIDDVPATPATLKPRVEEIIAPAPAPMGE